MKKIVPSCIFIIHCNFMSGKETLVFQSIFDPFDESEI